MTSGRAGDGLLPLDKPVGPTSHDMVARARRELGIRKVGHTGTLDPFASGLLLLLVGRATRLAEYLDAFPKEYVARVRLGVRTTTDDPEGEVLSRSGGWEDLSRSAVTAALCEFEGTGLQRPPTYSAKKLGGEPAYALARRGREISLPEALVTVHEIVLVSMELPHIDLRIRCSTGTYIRALGRDLGDRLGFGAHLTALRRTSIGPFRVEDAVSPEDLGDTGLIASAWIPPILAVAHLPRIEIGSDAAKRLEAGQFLAAGDYDLREAEGALAMTQGERLVALATREGDRIRPRKVFPIE